MSHLTSVKYNKKLTVKKIRQTFDNCNLEKGLVECITTLEQPLTEGGAHNADKPRKYDKLMKDGLGISECHLNAIPTHPVNRGSDEVERDESPNRVPRSVDFNFIEDIEDSTYDMITTEEVDESIA